MPSPPRRSLPVRFPLLLGAALLAAGGAWLAFRGPDDRPDVVLVVWDTCRADRVAAMGYGRPTTPRLEALAAEGVRYLQCLTPSPWTPPAHGALFTGLLPRSNGLVQGMGDRVRPGIPLLAETLRDVGYETVGVMGNSYLSGVTGLTEGFEVVRPFYDRRTGKNDGMKAVELVRQWLADRRRLGGKRRPVFLFVNLMDSHLPYFANPDDLAAVRDPAVPDADLAAVDGFTPKDALGDLYGITRRTPGELRALSTLYDGEIRHLDAVTGSLLDALREGGIGPGAFVAVAGDHGENLGEHGEMSHGMSLYEPVLHVPLVVRWPGRLDGGRTVESQVRLQDLYPTILEAARVAVPPTTGLDALSLTASPLAPRTLVAQFDRPLPYLEDAKASFPGAPEAAFSRFQVTLDAVREPVGVPGARKYIRYTRRLPDGREVVEREELFDLAADPAEARNLLGPGARPEDVETARRLGREIR